LKPDRSCTADRSEPFHHGIPSRATEGEPEVLDCTFGPEKRAELDHNVEIKRGSGQGVDGHGEATAKSVLDSFRVELRSQVLPVLLKRSIPLSFCHYVQATTS